MTFFERQIVMDKEIKSNVDEYGFGQLDSWFIDKYLKHDDETLEEAKARVKAEQDAKNNTR